MHSAVVFEGARPTPQQLNFAFPLFPHSLSLKGVPPPPSLFMERFLPNNSRKVSPKLFSYFKARNSSVSKPEFNSADDPRFTIQQHKRSLSSSKLEAITPEIAQFFYVPLFCAKKRGEENIHFCNACARPVANTEKIYLGTN